MNNLKPKISWFLSAMAKLRRGRIMTTPFIASDLTKHNFSQSLNNRLERSSVLSIVGRNYSGDSDTQVMAATYEEVKDIPNHPEQYLIDVRDRNELEKTGVLPGSINIPLVELNSAFQMSEEEFRNTFKREKPNQDAVIIFSCLAGGRARNATNVAQTLGYKNAKVYKGSWSEYAQKEGLPIK